MDSVKYDLNLFQLLWSWLVGKSSPKTGNALGAETSRLML